MKKVIITLSIVLLLSYNPPLKSEARTSHPTKNTLSTKEVEKIIANYQVSIDSINSVISHKVLVIIDQQKKLNN